jgi:Xaa-Pro aminopeptidase
VGIDIIELPVLFALQKEGIKVVDGQALMSEARLIKTRDEITLLNTSAMMVDAAYDELYRAMKPGMSENQAVGLVSKVLYDLGSEYVEAVNAISGERCNPHPHVFSDRVLRPGDPVYYDILHSYMGYRTCYYRCFTIGYASHAMNDAYKRCREYLDAAIELVRPGRTTAEIAAVWPKAQEFGFPNEEAAFALQYGHGIGLAIWEKPVISRLVSLEHSGPQSMAGVPRASKKKSSLPKPVMKSSHVSRPRSSWLLAGIISRSMVPFLQSEKRHPHPANACAR